MQSRGTPRVLAPLSLLAMLAGAVAPAQAPADYFEVVDENATMADKLGSFAALDTSFTDSSGERVELRSLAAGERPVILNLGYFTCPGMCGMVLQSLVTALGESDMLPGREFDLWTISIDHREDESLARDKKATYLDAFGHPEVGDHWRFLVGGEDQIKKLSDSVGWRFRWSDLTTRYDHPPVIVMLSPDGRATRYLDARTLTGSTLRRAVIEAGEGKVGSFLERILVSCLTFDPNTGVYSMTAMTVMRLGGGLTVLGLGIMLFLLWRRERARVAAAAASPRATPVHSGSTG